MHVCGVIDLVICQCVDMDAYSLWLNHVVVLNMSILRHHAGVWTAGEVFGVVMGANAI